MKSQLIFTDKIQFFLKWHLILREYQAKKIFRHLQAVVDGKYNQFENLFHSIPAFRAFGRTNLVNGFITLKLRTMSMINSTAEQRYANLINTRPNIFQNVPLKYIAPYLGITDTSLSRIRKQMMKK